MNRTVAITTLVAALAAASPAARADEPLAVLVSVNSLASMQDIAKAYERLHPGSHVTISPAASKVIVTEVQEHLPADVVVLSSTSAGDGDLEESTPAFSDHTVLVVSRESKVQGPKDLGNPGVRIAWGTTNSINAKFAEDTVANLAKAFGPDYAARVERNILIRRTSGVEEEGVIEGGSADAAFVLAAEVSPAVRTIDLGKASVVVPYSVAVVKSTKNPTEAKAFLDFVVSPAAQAIFKSHRHDPAH